MNDAGRHRVVIVGGGFGGLYAAQALRRVPVDVTLVDRCNYHLFQPLLYQVATGGLSPADIAAPLRSVLRRQRRTEVLLGEVTEVDVHERVVVLADGGRVPYDTLLVAAGAEFHYFDHPEWSARAPGLKSIQDATAIRRRILGSFEQAERTTDPAARQRLLTFVVVGGGPTGVELAGAIAEIAHHVLPGEFRHIDPTAARIVLLEMAERVLPPYPPELSREAATALAHLGVTVRCGTRVLGMDDSGVEVEHDGRAERIEAHTLLWAAGVRAAPLAATLAAATGAVCDRGGRLHVGPDLCLPGHPEILVLGDMAHCPDSDGAPLPGLAPVAMQQGRHAARLIAARLAGRTPPPFRYRDRGTMATIGRAAAVVDLGWLRFAGFPAWLAWLFLHLLYLVGFENRVLVATQWAWNYVTKNRSARLIVE